MSFVFVQGDNEPDISATLHREGDPLTIVDLNDADEVRFQMRKADDRKFTVDAEGVIIDPDAGTVRYSWGNNDLSIPGEYEVQWQVIYTDARRQTTAPTQTITVRRR